MPTTAQIEAKSTATLTALERERVREILQYSAGKMEGLNAMLDDLTSAQNQFVRAWIDRWDAIGDDTEKIAGGSDALDADPERNREMVRRRIRNLLGLPELSGIATLDRSELIGSVTLPNRWSGSRSEM